jgi:ketosteroid isomerase-like protein
MSKKIQADLVRELFAIIDDGTDWSRLSEVFAPGAVYFRPGYKPMRGIADIKEFYAEKRQILVGAHHIYRILSDGPRCCCWGRFSGRTKVNGKIALYFTDWYRFSNELISYRRTFFYQPMI